MGWKCKYLVLTVIILANCQISWSFYRCSSVLSSNVENEFILIGGQRVQRETLSNGAKVLYGWKPGYEGPRLNAAGTRQFLKQHFSEFQFFVLEDTGREIDETSNCHGYSCAMSGVRGVKPGAFIIDGNHSYNAGSQGFSDILETEFDKIAEFPSIEDLEKVEEVRLEDIVVFRSNNGVLHSGVVVTSRSEDGTLWIRSKLGYHAVFDSTLAGLNAIYDASSFEVFRISK